MKEFDQVDSVAPEFRQTETHKGLAAELPAGGPASTQPASFTGDETGDEKNDKRAASRYHLSASADAFEPQSRTRISGRLADLGVGGCYIDTVSSFPVGTAVRLRLVSEGRTLQAAAMVTYTSNGMGMGLAFTRMSPEQANILSTWLAELSGEAAPEPEPDWDRPPESPPNIHPGPDSYSSQNLIEAAGELVDLLTQKHILTEAESQRLRKKFSR